MNAEATDVEVDLYSLTVHPAAEIFPMMDNEQLIDLADDIAANGLQQPIVIGTFDGALQIVDGRNRLAACKLAKIEPTHVMFDGADPTAFILSANVNRRHMAKGQRAMAVAMLYPEPKREGRGKKSLITKDFSSGMLSQARTVLRVLPDAARCVMAGTKTLSDAYREAQAHESANRTEAARLEELRAGDPDLHESVLAQKCSLEDAEQKASSRRETERAQRVGTFEVLLKLDALHALFRSTEARAAVTDSLGEHGREFEDYARTKVSDWRTRALQLSKNIQTWVQESEHEG